MVLGGPTDLINRLATMEVVSQPLSPQCWEKILNYECTTMKCTHIVLLEESFRIVINTAAIAAGRAPVLLVLLVLVVLILLLLCQCSCCRRYYRGSGGWLSFGGGNLVGAVLDYAHVHH